MNIRTRKIKPTVILVVLAAVLSLAALAADDTPCIVEGCDGIYVDGFCTSNNHIQLIATPCNEAACNGRYVGGVCTKNNAHVQATATPCDEDGCDGTYVNGFCTANDTHYQKPNIFTDTDGTKVYEVGNAGQLYWIAAQTNDIDNPNNFAGCVVRLTADIVVNPGTFDEDGNYTPAATEEAGTTPRTWTPIGNGEYISALKVSCAFSGIFDGDGHTVSGLYASGDIEYLALIGYLSSTNGKTAGVFDVGVINSYFYSEYKEICMGGIVGSANSCNNNSSDVFIANCFSTATLAYDGNGGECYVGGIVGHAYISPSENPVDMTVINCYNHGTIIVNNCQGYNCVGGIVGSASASAGSASKKATMTFTLCYNVGEIDVKDFNGENYVGSIVGYADKTSKIGTNVELNVSDCFYKLEYGNDGFEDGFNHLDSNGNDFYGIGCTGGDDDIAGWGRDHGTQPVDEHYGLACNGTYASKLEYNLIAWDNGSLADYLSIAYDGYRSDHAHDGTVLIEYYKRKFNEADDNTYEADDNVYYGRVLWRQTVGTDAYPNFTGERVEYTQFDELRNIHIISKSTGLCIVCGKACSHDNVVGGSYCRTCGYECPHESFDDNGCCTNCHYGFEAPTKNSDGVYEIKNAGNLYAYALNHDADAVLTVDIALNPGTFDKNGNYIPAGDETVRQWHSRLLENYSYTFDGDGHTISGLYHINFAFEDTSVHGGGLFSSVGSGTVKNVNIKGAYIKTNGSIGGIATGCEGTISNCTFNGTIDGYNVGGIAYANAGTVVNCLNAGTINAYNRAGGVVNSLQSGGKIENCGNIGAITGIENIVCGVAASFAAGTGTKIENCYNAGTLTSPAEVQHITLKNANDYVKNCYYLADEESDYLDGTTAKTAKQFASGEVAYLLNGGSEEGVWKQTVSAAPSNKFPSFEGLTVTYNAEKGEYYNDIAVLPSVKGAQIRNNGEYGLRFGFVYDGSEAAVGKYDAGSIVYGALLVPQEIIGTKAVTLETMKALKDEAGEDVIADVVREHDFDTSNQNAIIYTAVLYDIPHSTEDDKYGVDVVAVPYVKFSVGGVAYTAYGESIVRSVNAVQAIIDGWSENNA